MDPTRICKIRPNQDEGGCIEGMHPTSSDLEPCSWSLANLAKADHATLLIFTSWRLIAHVQKENKLPPTNHAISNSLSIG